MLGSAAKAEKAMDSKEIQAQIDADGGELVKVQDLIPWDRNPRINEAAAAKLSEFIRDKGWGAPVLVQRGTNRIIGGHTRWKAAKKLGLKRIPVRYRTCDDRTADALAMADNKLAEAAEWDSQGVAEILSGFGLEEAEAMGWASADIERLLSLTNTSEAGDAFSEWSEMPEFKNEDDCYRKIIVNFADAKGVEEFFALIGQKFTEKTKSIWHPYKEQRDMASLAWKAPEK